MAPLKQLQCPEDKKLGNKNYRSIATMKELWFIFYKENLKNLGVPGPMIEGLKSKFQHKLETTPFEDLCQECECIREELTHGINRDHEWLPKVDIEEEIGFRTIHLIVNFPRKVKLVRPDLQTAAIKKFLDVEEHHSFSFDPVIVAQLEEIIHKWFLCWPKDPVYQPGHGPGVTAEGYTAEVDKYAGLNVTRREVKELYRIGFDLSRDLPIVESHRPARQAFVDKTWKALRGISAEPCGLQWAEQAVMKVGYSFLFHHPYLGKKVTLWDQQLNQQLARVGSKFCNYATIDYSQASDLISAPLVYKLFKRTPLRRTLMVLRSSYAEVGSTCVRLRKYAPMGSALTFFVESIIFAAVAELACMRAGVAKDWSVYGDDVIIPAAAYEQLRIVSEALSFCLNEQKSFASEFPFRESCGREYYKGYDVTPTYFRIPAESNRTVAASNFPAWVDLYNRLYMQGYKETSNAILGLLTGARYGKQKQPLTLLYQNYFDKLARPDSGALCCSGTGSVIQFVDWIPMQYGTRAISRVEWRLRDPNCVLLAIPVRGQIVKDWLAARQSSNEDLELGVYRSWPRDLRIPGFRTGRWVVES